MGKREWSITWNDDRQNSNEAYFQGSKEEMLEWLNQLLSRSKVEGVQYGEIINGNISEYKDL